MFLSNDVRIASGLKQDSAGRWLCECGTALDEDQSMCPACVAKLLAERERRDRELFVADWRARIERHIQFPQAPDWCWARLDNEEFAAKIKGKKLLHAARMYAFDAGPLLFSGPTGCGKTACVRAILHRIASKEVKSILSQKAGTPPTRLLRQLRQLAWIDGFSLAQARKQNPLGRGEAELVQRAFEAPLLVLDELGFEPLFDTVIAEVANRRYTDGTPVIVTTGLKPAAFRERYGDACWRRFAERGTVVEEW